MCFFTLPRLISIFALNREQMYHLRLILVLLLCSSALVLEASTNPENVNLQVSASSTVSFTVTSDIGDPNVSFSPSAGIVTQTPVSGNQHEISYTPNVGFTGEDVFSIESVVLEGGFFPKTERTLVYVTVVPSVVNAADDFVIVSDTNPIVIQPLDNDSSDSESHVLTGIVDVSSGSALMGPNSSLEYTPAEITDVQYIVYSIVDSIGTADIATVYLLPDVNLTGDFSEEFSISSDQNQYLFLPDASFSVETGPTSGAITSVNDRVFIYTPDVAEAVDVIVFSNTEGDSWTFTVSVYPSAADIGVVQDDAVFTSVGNTIVFDVLANDFDNDLSLDLNSLSPELEYLGAGEISFTPEAGFAGLKEFTYVASNAYTSETGHIRVAVTNFNPQVEQTYEFATVQEGVLSLGYDVPLKDFYFEVASDPQFGDLTYHDGQTIVNTNCGDVVGKNVIYTPVTGFTGVDEFDLLYCPDNGVNPCELIKTTVQVDPNPEGDCSCVDDCVWSGDANNDGRVDMLDVLTIGRNLGQTGSSRDNAEIWQGQGVSDWSSSNVYGVNAKHSDADGNGVITVEDMSAAVSNYDLVHTYSQSNVLNVKDYPFSLVPRSTNVEVGDRMYIDVVLGTADYPVVDMSGIAFKISLDPAVIDSASANFEFDPNGYFRKQSPFADVVLQPVDGTIIVGGTKTNLSTSNGHGIIATLDFIVEEDIDGVKTPEKWRSVKSTYTFDMAAVDIILEDGNGYQFSIADVRDEVEIDLQTEEVETVPHNDKLQVYPNPAADALVVEASVGDVINLHDVLGNLLHTEVVSTANSLTIDVSEYAIGTYALTRKGILTAETVKVVVAR